jgi:hypothetical protein
MSFLYARWATGTVDGQAARRLLERVEATTILRLLVDFCPVHRGGDAGRGSTGSGMLMNRPPTVRLLGGWERAWLAYSS